MAASTNKACEEAFMDYMEATRELFAVRQEEDRKKKEVRVRRVSCEAEKEEAKRKEAELTQALRNRAGELKGLEAKLQNHLAYAQEK